MSITKEYRGKHIACDFLELGIEELKKNWHNIITVVAEVKDENVASNALFLRKGFELVSKVNTYKLNVFFGKKTLYNIRNYSYLSCDNSHTAYFNEVA